jgi:hypothetical protein
MGLKELFRRKDDMKVFSNLKGFLKSLSRLSELLKSKLMGVVFQWVGTISIGPSKFHSATQLSASFPNICATATAGVE